MKNDNSICGLTTHGCKLYYINDRAGLVLRVGHPESFLHINLKKKIMPIPSFLLSRCLWAIFCFVPWDLIHTHRDDPLWDLPTNLAIIIHECLHLSQFIKLVLVS